MADMIQFSGDPRPDLYAMDRPELLACLQNVRAETDRLDEREPENMDSPEHEAWGSLHEELEDLMDEIMDLLDQL